MVHRRVLLGLLLVLHSAPARAGGIDVTTGVGGALSAWRGDAGPQGWGLVGYRFNRLVVLEGSGRLGYAPVDKRTLVVLGLGASLWAPTGLVRPMVRLAVLHQHEEPRDALVANVFEAVMGVGDGIRHRAGLEAATGVGFEISRLASSPLLLGLDVRGSLHPDTRGPRWYFGGGLWASVQFDLNPS